MLFRALLVSALFLLTTQSPALAADSGSEWAWLGPEGGPLGPFVFSSEDPTLIFAASDNGVWRSQDEGASWVRVASGLTDPNVFSLVRSGSILLAGTRRHGVFRSENAGESWQPMESPGLDGQWVLALTVDPRDATRVFAGTAQAGVFRSGDGGGTWVASNEGLEDPTVTGIAVSPLDSETVYATVATGAYRSADGGQSWTNVTFNLRLPAPPPVESRNVTHPLEVNQRGEPMVAGLGGLYALRGQEEWDSLPFSPFSAGLDFGTTVALHPTNPDEILAATETALWRTPNGGLAWEQIPVANLRKVSARGLDYHPSEPAKVFVGATGGTFISEDSGSTWWETRRGLRAGSISSVGIDPRNPLVLYGGGLGGASKTVSRNQWVPIRGELDGLSSLSFAEDAGDPNLVFTSNSQGVYRSRDAGLHWELNLFSVQTAFVVTHPSVPGLAFASAQVGDLFVLLPGISRSRDSGDTWENVTGELLGMSFTRILPSRFDPNRVWVATSAGVFLSSQMGGSWQEINGGLTDGDVVALEEDLSGAVFAGTRSGRIFRLSDPTGVWTELTQPTTLAIRDLAASPRDGNLLYAATEGEGLFVSQDGGEIWTAVEGLENPYLSRLRFSRDGRTLYAAGHGGVYERVLETAADLGATISEEVAGNPFARGLVTFSVHLGRPSNAESAVTYRFQQALPPGLQLIDASADGGDVFAGPAFNSVTWTGDLDSDIVLRIQAEILDGATGRDLATQGVLFREDDPLGPRSVGADGSNPTGTGATVVQITPTPFQIGTLAVPRSLGMDATFVGVALLNPSLNSAQLEFQGLDANGHTVETFARDGALGFNAQFAGLTGDVVDSGQTVLIQSPGTDLEGFFLLGDNQLDRLDGVGGAPLDSQRLFLPRIQQTSARRTYIFLFNPDPATPSQASLDLRDTRGESRRMAQIVLPPHGSIWASADEIFPGLEAEDGYLRVDADHPLRGFELVATDRNFETLPALPTQYADRLRAPHAFFGGGLGTTRLRLLNTGRHDLRIRVRMFDDRLGLLGEPMVTLEAGELRVIDLADLFPSQDEVLQGSLRLDATTIDSPVPVPPGLLGAVEYQSEDHSMASTLPLQAHALNSPHFLHVAQSNGLGIYQGLALLDVGVSPDFGFFSFGGFLVAFGRAGFPSEFTILPSLRIRLSGLLNDPSLFGSSFSQEGGHLEIQAPSPLFAYAIFGGPRFLSAIVPQGKDLFLY